MLEKLRRMKTEDCLYLFGWIAFFLAFFFTLLVHQFPQFFFLSGMEGTCLFHHFTGYYCPGCGGTRSAIAFFTFHPLKSLWYNPFVTYLLTVYILFMLTHTVARLSKNRIQGMRFRLSYIYIGAGILTAQFLLKNLLLYFFHYSML